MSKPMAPPEQAAALQERVLAVIARLQDLPASEIVVRKALAQMENPDFAIADLKKVLMSDQAVAARILRLANSAYFGFRSEVQTVSQAIVLLGQTRIRTLLYRILADKLLADLGHGKSAAAAVLRASLATATASCVLSQLLSREDAEEMLLAGLLHNVGELLYASHFPAEYDRVRRGEEETAVFGLTSGQAGGLLLKNWNFPPFYSAVAEHSSDPLSPGCPPELIHSVALVHAGKKLAEQFLAGADVSKVAEQIHSSVRENFDLDTDLLAEVYVTLPQRMSMEQLQAGRN